MATIITRKPNDTCTAIQVSDTTKWAVWLNTSDNKKVIAPHTWFATNHINSADLIPKKWLQLKRASMMPHALHYK